MAREQKTRSKASQASRAQSTQPAATTQVTLEPKQTQPEAEIIATAPDATNQPDATLVDTVHRSSPLFSLRSAAMISRSHGLVCNQSGPHGPPQSPDHTQHHLLLAHVPSTPSVPNSTKKLAIIRPQASLPPSQRFINLLHRI